MAVDLLVVNREILAWCAGFIDGEGTFSGYKRKGGGNRVLQVTVSQVVEEPLNRLVDAFGVGKVYGPYERIENELSTQKLFTYKATGYENFQHILSMVWEWLCEPKREQAIRYLKEYNDAYVRPPKSEHGMRSMYGNNGCRCEPCKKAHSDYMREYYKKKKKKNQWQ